MKCDFCRKEASVLWTICCQNGQGICYRCSISHPDFTENLVCQICQRQLGIYLYDRLQMEIAEFFQKKTFEEPRRQPQRQSRAYRQTNRNMQRNQRYPQQQQQYANHPIRNNRISKNEEFEREYKFERNQKNGRNQRVRNQQIPKNLNQQYSHQSKFRPTKMEIQTMNPEGNYPENNINYQKEIRNNEGKPYENYQQYVDDIEMRLCAKLDNFNYSMYDEEQNQQNPTVTQNVYNNSKKQGQFLARSQIRAKQDDGSPYSFGRCKEELNQIQYNGRNINITGKDIPRRLQRSSSSIIFRKDY